MTRPSSSTTRSILYAEDDCDDVFFMQRAFRAARREESLHVVPDGEQAIAYLAGTGAFTDRGQHPVPSLVLLDLNMPLCPGLDVLKWIRAQNDFAALPVVVLTSSALEADMNRALALGATRYVIKPGHPDGLVELVKTFAEYWTPETSKSPGRSLVA